jgi:hypothetical protein
MLQRTLPAGFIAPCLPTKTTQLPSGGQWLHEIKHDGLEFRWADGQLDAGNGGRAPDQPTSCRERLNAERC